MSSNSPAMSSKEPAISKVEAGSLPASPVGARFDGEVDDAGLTPGAKRRALSKKVFFASVLIAQFTAGRWKPSR